MTWKLSAGVSLSALFGLAALAACSGEPLSLEEQRAREIETYCRTVADAERSNAVSEADGSQIDEIGKDDEVWEGAAEGSDQSAKYQAAYSECLEKNRPEPE